MSVYCESIGRSLRSSDSNTKMFVKGAPESILERCASVRVGKETVPMTESMRKTILENVTAYRTGIFFLLTLNEFLSLCVRKMLLLF